jgi:hypothetical protein
MSGGTGWNGPLEFGSSLTLWGQLKEAAVPVVTYWVWLALAFGSFSLSVVIAGNTNSTDFLFLAAFAVGTFGGLAFGQLSAVLRVRTWVLLGLGALMWTVFFVFLAGGGTAIMNNDMVAAFVISILFLGPVAMTGGLWSLETNRALWSTWLPMVYTIGAALIWLEDHGALSRFESGNKFAVWDLVGLAFFVPSVGMFLLYLVTRETHRLATWRRGPTAPLRPSVEERGVSRPRITLLGLVLLGALTLGVAGATALIAPYLWRTGPQDGNGNGGGDQQQEQGDGQGSGRPKPCDAAVDGPNCKSEETEPDDGSMEQMVQQVVEAAKQAGGTICSVLSIALLALLGALLAYRPVKRLIVLRHLREPLWDVAPTTRIEQCWRLVEIALGDAGVEARAGEDAAHLARRAAPTLAALSPVPVHGLEDAAEVADRVRFGLGVGPDDVAVIERFSKWALDTVWERLDDKAQVAAMYRGV